jgi:60 kDa SS-A/Ro ribonucleoprotein
VPGYLARLFRRVAAEPEPIPQSEPLPATVPNSAGGHAFPVDDWTRLDRFLILGSEGGSYYAAERRLTLENAQAVARCLAADGPRTVARIVAVSAAGRAPKPDPALFALALATAAPDLATRRAALAALPRICRTGAHLLHFAALADGLRGWGRGLRRAVGRWYLAQEVHALGYQLLKYRQREGWSQRDLLRLSHPETDEPARRALFDWVCRGTTGATLPPLVAAAAELGRCADAAHVAALIRAHDLPREAVPTPLLNEAAVWDALLDRMPLGALIRSLGKLAAVGVLGASAEEYRPEWKLALLEACGRRPPPPRDRTPDVVAALQDRARVARARLHPLGILLAQRVYAQGHGERGRLRWAPVPAVVQALDAAFHAAFRYVEPARKRLVVAVDISASMGCGGIAGTTLTPREAAAALALLLLTTEPQVHVLGFGDTLVPLKLRSGMPVDQAVRVVSDLPFGATDCALPMLHALAHGIEADGFVVLTDSETWAGAIHPAEALRRYRAATGIAAKLVVMGMVSNGFSIADPDDAGMLDVVGFDAAAPALVTDFLRG